MSTEAQKKLFRKYKITARKHEGDDAYSWCIFVNGSPRMKGLTRPEVDYYKRSILKTIMEREQCLP